MNNSRWILKCGLGIFLGFVPFVGFGSSQDEQEASSLAIVFDGAEAPNQDSPVVPGDPQGVQQVNEAPGMSPRMIDRNKELFLENMQTAQMYHKGFINERRRALVGGIVGGVGGGLYALAQYAPLVLSVAGYATGGILGLAALGLLLGTVGKDQKTKTGAGIVFDVVATVGLGVLSVLSLLSFLNPVTAATVALTALAVGGGAWGAINGIGSVIDLVRRNKAARRAEHFLNELPQDERQRFLKSLTGDCASNGHTSA